jgi:hypothetical protein
MRVWLSIWDAAWRCDRILAECRIAIEAQEKSRNYRAVRVIHLIDTDGFST